MTEILLALEILGTVAFAVSGSLVAIKGKLDLFGVLIIGCITAVGGGIMRDTMLGALPPAIFSRGYIVLIGAVTSLAVFILSFLNRTKLTELYGRIEIINNVFDAIGLGAFTVMGTEVAVASSDNAFLIITLGTLTAVGGGIIRDVLTNSTPYIFKKHIYAVTSILGSTVYYLVRLVSTDVILPSALGLLLVIVLRLLATKFRWKLPKVHIEE